MRNRSVASLRPSSGIYICVCGWVCIVYMLHWLCRFALISSWFKSLRFHHPGKLSVTSFESVSSCNVLAPLPLPTPHFPTAPKLWQCTPPPPTHPLHPTPPSRLGLKSEKQKGGQSQSSVIVWESRWPSWAPVPNKPTVSVDVMMMWSFMTSDVGLTPVDVKQHSTKGGKSNHHKRLAYRKIWSFEELETLPAGAKYHTSELRSCVKVEVDVLGSRPL